MGVPSLLLVVLGALASIQERAVPAARSAPSGPREIPVRTVDGVELALDAYLPAGAGPHPALLLVHGGAWMHGNKRDMNELATLLASRGYACFAPAYRLAPRHRYPAQLEDCAYALQFVRSKAGELAVDPERIGALGFSAGGHLAALLGVLDDRRDPESADLVQRESSRVACVVAYFPATLLTRKQELDFDTLPPPELFGDAPDSAYAEASPVHHVTSDDAPFLFVHGDADDTVPVGHSLLMDEKLRAAGVRSELFVVPGGGHGDFLRREPQGAYWKRTEAFLAELLELDER
jgi:acetyl esterase/lipase